MILNGIIFQRFVLHSNLCSSSVFILLSLSVTWFKIIMFKGNNSANSMTDYGVREYCQNKRSINSSILLFHREKTQ